MPTSKNVTAKRPSTKKTTGPIPIDAHSAFRFNARMRTINQDPAQLTAEYREHFIPSGFHERFLVDSLVHKESRLRQLRIIEADIWQDATNLADFGATIRALLRIQRLMESYQDNYRHTLKQLERLHASQTKPSKATSAATSAKSASFRQKPQTPPEAA